MIVQTQKLRCGLKTFEVILRNGTQALARPMYELVGQTTRKGLQDIFNGSARLEFTTRALKLDVSGLLSAIAETRDKLFRGICSKTQQVILNLFIQNHFRFVSLNFTLGHILIDNFTQIIDGVEIDILQLRHLWLYIS